MVRAGVCLACPRPVPLRLIPSDPKRCSARPSVRPWLPLAWRRVFAGEGLCFLSVCLSISVFWLHSPKHLPRLLTRDRGG